MAKEPNIHAQNKYDELFTHIDVLLGNQELLDHCEAVIRRAASEAHGNEVQTIKEIASPAEALAVIGLSKSIELFLLSKSIDPAELIASLLSRPDVIDKIKKHANVLGKILALIIADNINDTEKISENSKLIEELLTEICKKSTEIIRKHNMQGIPDIKTIKKIINEEDFVSVIISMRTFLFKNPHLLEQQFAEVLDQQEVQKKLIQAVRRSLTPEPEAAKDPPRPDDVRTNFATKLIKQNKSPQRFLLSYTERRLATGNFSEIDFSKEAFNFKDLELNEFNFREAKLAKVTFDNCAFIDTDFTGCFINSNISFKNCRFDSKSFRTILPSIRTALAEGKTVDLTGVTFVGDFSGVNFSGLNLAKTNFYKAKLKNANFESANLTDAQLPHEVEEGVNLRGITFKTIPPSSSLGENLRRSISRRVATVVASQSDVEYPITTATPTSWWQSITSTGPVKMAQWGGTKALFATQAIVDSITPGIVLRAAGNLARGGQRVLTAGRQRVRKAIETVQNFGSPPLSVSEYIAQQKVKYPPAQAAPEPATANKIYARKAWLMAEMLAKDISADSQNILSIQYNINDILSEIYEKFDRKTIQAYEQVIKLYSYNIVQELTLNITDLLENYSQTEIGEKYGAIDIENLMDQDGNINIRDLKKHLHELRDKKDVEAANKINNLISKVDSIFIEKIKLRLGEIKDQNLYDFQELRDKNPLIFAKKNLNKILDKINNADGFWGLWKARATFLANAPAIKKYIGKETVYSANKTDRFKELISSDPQTKKKTLQAIKNLLSLTTKGSFTRRVIKYFAPGILFQTNQDLFLSQEELRKTFSITIDCYHKLDGKEQDELVEAIADFDFAKLNAIINTNTTHKYFYDVTRILSRNIRNTSSGSLEQTSIVETPNLFRSIIKARKLRKPKATLDVSNKDKVEVAFSRLSGTDKAQIDLHNIKFNDVVIKESQLTNVDFSFSEFNRLSLSKSSLTKVNFTNVSCSEVTIISDCTITDVDFSGFKGKVEFKNCKFKGNYKLPTKHTYDKNCTFEQQLPQAATKLKKTKTSVNNIKFVDIIDKQTNNTSPGPLAVYKDQTLILENENINSKHIDLSQIIFGTVTIKKSNLTDIDFSACGFKKLTISDSTLTTIDFSGSKARSSVFSDPDTIVIENCTLKHVIFDKLDCKIKFVNCNFEGNCTFPEKHMIFEKCTFDQQLELSICRKWQYSTIANPKDTILPFTDFELAIIARKDAKEILDLRHKDIKLESSDIGTDTETINLSRTKFRKLILENSDLFNVDFSSSEFEELTIDGGSLTKIKFNNAQITTHNKPIVISNCTLKGVDFSGFKGKVVFKNCNFEGDCKFPSKFEFQESELNFNYTNFAGTAGQNIIFKNFKKATMNHVDIAMVEFKLSTSEELIINNNSNLTKVKFTSVFKETLGSAFYKHDYSSYDPKNLVISDCTLNDVDFSEFKGKVVFKNCKFEGNCKLPEKQVIFENCTVDQQLEGIICQKWQHSEVANSQDTKLPFTDFELAIIARKDAKETLDLRHKDIKLESSDIVTNTETINLSHTQFRKLTIKDSNLTNFDFSSSEFEELKISGGSLTKINFSNAKITDHEKPITISDCTLKDVDFSGFTGKVLFKNCKFEGNCKFPTQVTYDKKCTFEQQLPQATISPTVQSPRQSENNITIDQIIQAAKQRTPRAETLDFSKHQELSLSFVDKANLKLCNIDFPKVTMNYATLTNVDFSACSFKKLAINGSRLTDVTFKNVKCKEKFHVFGQRITIVQDCILKNVDFSGFKGRLEFKNCTFEGNCKFPTFANFDKKCTFDEKSMEERQKQFKRKQKYEIRASPLQYFLSPPVTPPISSRPKTTRRGFPPH